jgi:hypothetical protein
MSLRSSSAVRRRHPSVMTPRSGGLLKRPARLNEQALKTIGLTAEQLRVAFPYVARLLQIFPLGAQGSAIRRHRRFRNGDVT